MLPRLVPLWLKLLWFLAPCRYDPCYFSSRSMGRPGAWRAFCGRVCVCVCVCFCFVLCAAAVGTEAEDRDRRHARGQGRQSLQQPWVPVSGADGRGMVVGFRCELLVAARSSCSICAKCWSEQLDARSVFRAVLPLRVSLLLGRGIDRAGRSPSLCCFFGLLRLFCLFYLRGFMSLTGRRAATAAQVLLRSGSLRVGTCVFFFCPCLSCLSGPRIPVQRHTRGQSCPLVVAAELQTGPLDGPGASLRRRSASWALNLC